LSYSRTLLCSDPGQGTTTPSADASK